MQFRTLAAVAAALFLCAFTTESKANWTNDGRFIYDGDVSAPMGARQYTHSRSRISAHKAKSHRTAHGSPKAKPANGRASLGHPEKPIVERPAPIQEKHIEEAKPAERLADLQTVRGGMVRVKTAYGFYITVHPVAASKFLRLFAMAKARGYRVNPGIVGCFSGGHKPGSNHRIGMACDVQTGWNRGPSFVYHWGDLIRRAGLYDGCSFGDCGHVEAVRGLYNHSPNLYSSLQQFKSEQEKLRITEAAP